MRFGRQIRRMMKKPRESEELAKGSMFLVTVFLCLGLIIVSAGIENYFVEDLKINARNLARGYTHSLRKTEEASEAVRTLIHEKLRYTAEVTSDLSDAFSHEDLKAIAKEIDVDEIHVFDSHGKICFSNLNYYVGWNAPSGHPVREFLKSKESFHLDPLRENIINRQLVLYGYKRLEDGGAIQVGINTKHLEGLIQSLELNKMMMEMTGDDEVAYVTYIDENRHVIGSSEGGAIGRYLPEKKQEYSLLEALRSGTLHLKDETNVYEVEEPVFMDGVESGSLVIGLSLERTRSEIEKLTRIFAVVQGMIYLSAILMLYLYHQKSAKLHTIAYVDELTSLPNIKYLRSELEYKLISSKEENLALILILLPRYAKITMTRGQEQGERILAELARRFRNMESENLSFYKHSDEKFLLLVRGYEDREQLLKILRSLSHPGVSGVLEQEARFSSLRFGILELKGKEKSVDKVLKDVLIALNHAEHHQGLYYSFFDQKMEQKVERENQIEAALKDAMKGSSDAELFLQYQPIIGKWGYEIFSAEALARVRSKKLGMISPVEFIEVAERNGLMGHVGLLILEKACDFSKVLEKATVPIRISVNISGVQILEEDFICKVKKILTEKEVSPSSLSFEITESVFIGNYDIINAKLKVLKDLGITITIDDFGTGYSSFARLKELHVDGVKIDRHFIQGISQLPEEEQISADIIRMVHKYGLYTVAEGVETEKELSYLHRESCDYIQGYYYSKPLGEEEFLLYWKNFTKETLEG